MWLELTYKEMLEHPDKKKTQIIYNGKKITLRFLRSNMQHIQYKTVKLYQSMYEERNGEPCILNSAIVLL